MSPSRSAAASGAVSASILPAPVFGKASQPVLPPFSQASMSTPSGSEAGCRPSAFSSARARAIGGSSGTGGKA